jgi:hypothetical protein
VFPFQPQSYSVVTIPIIDTGVNISAPSPVTIVGFLQAFINGVEPGVIGVSPADNTPDDVNITVLNVVGCSANASNTPPNPVVGGWGASPIPVRLISP